MISLVILAFAVTACNANQFQRIVNGENTDISEHPWQLSLQFNGGHTCGAVLIKENIALTAAHCVQRQHENFTIIAGVSSLDDNNKKIVKIGRILSHPNYSGQGGVPNDIAILFLNENLPKSSVIDPPNNITYEGRNCVITGWGLLSGGGPSPNQLQKAYTKVLSHGGCVNTFDNFVIKLLLNKDHHVCVYTGANGACNGDSGGPLVCYDDDVPKLVGLTSWGIAGCVTGQPSVYTRVSTYVEWVNANI